MEQRLQDIRQTATDDWGTTYRAPLSDEDVEACRAAILAKLTLAVGRTPDNASDRRWFVATALSVRDRVVNHWMEASRRPWLENRTKVYYLSLEFLIGRLLREVPHNLGVLEV